MKNMRSVSLIGEYNPTVIAHKAIPAALDRAATEGGFSVNWTWVHVWSRCGRRPGPRRLQRDLVCAGQSVCKHGRGGGGHPLARETRRPFLGTCGGFQHALLEYAEAVWGPSTASHAELDPEAPDPVIARLDCALVEATGEVRFAPRSRLAAIYGALRATETYCRYGLNPRYAARLEVGPLRVSARDGSGDVRAVELEGHPFFIATLYQPERAVLTGRSHPLIAAYVAAVSAWV